MPKVTGPTFRGVEEAVLASRTFDPAKFVVVTAFSTPLKVGPATFGKSGPP